MVHTCNSSTQEAVAGGWWVWVQSKTQSQKKKKRKTKQKYKNTEVLNNIVNEVELTDTFLTLYPKNRDHTFMLNAHVTFTKIKYKENLIKLQQ
jgi:hypothetical protein